MPSAGYKIICNDNPSDCDENIRSRIYLTTTSHKDAKVNDTGIKH